MFTARPLHVGSVLAGFVLAGLFWGLTSFDGVGALSSAGTQRINLDPEPGSIVRIVEGQPYTVPNGQILVIKSIVDANTNGIASGRILVDGAPVTAARLDSGAVTFGFPVTARAGQVVTVEDAFGEDPHTIIVLGAYLANQRGR